MQKHTCLAALAVLAIANTACPIDLGLAVGTRPLLNRYEYYYYANRPSQVFGFHVLAEIPFSNTYRVSFRGGQMGAFMNTITLNASAPTDSFQATGFDAHVVFLALVPVTQDELKLSGGVGVGYSGCRTNCSTEEGYYDYRSSYGGLVLTLTAGTRLRLSKMVSVGIETEIIPVSVLLHEVSFGESSPAARYVRTQLGGGAGPTLNLSVLFTL